MAWGYVQSAYGQESNGDGTLAVALSSSVPVGSRIIVPFLYYKAFSASINVSSVTDNLGNTYALDRARQVVVADGTHYVYINVWSAPVTNSGTPTVTVVMNDSLTWLKIGVLEYSGLDTSASPVDVSASNGIENDAGPAASGSTSNTTAANELVIGMLSTQSGAHTYAPGGSWTQRVDGYANFETSVRAYEMDSGSSGTAQSISTTLGESTSWGAMCVVYKLSSSGVVIEPGIGSETFVGQVPAPSIAMANDARIAFRKA